MGLRLDVEIDTTETRINLNNDNDIKDGGNTSRVYKLNSKVLELFGIFQSVEEHAKFLTMTKPSGSHYITAAPVNQAHYRQSTFYEITQM